MIQIAPQMRILVAVEPVDFRKGVDGLAALCRQALSTDPMQGALFVFCSRRRHALRCLSYDGQGFWLCTKRLSTGKFQWWPSQETKEKSVTINSWDLQTLLGNGNPSLASFGKDWKKLASS